MKLFVIFIPVRLNRLHISCPESNPSKSDLLSTVREGEREREREREILSGHPRRFFLQSTSLYCLVAMLADQLISMLACDWSDSIM